MAVTRLKKQALREDRYAKMERNLMESLCDYVGELVNTNEAYFDNVTGQPWLPVGGYGPESDIMTWPFRNESQLALIRNKARIQWHKNPYAQDLLLNLQSFTVGTGHKYTSVMRRGDDIGNKPAEQLRLRLGEFLTALLKLNKWRKRQSENVLRYHRDGESFTRMFPQDSGMTLFRFIEPGCVYTPPQFSAIDHFDFGIETLEDDVETNVTFFVDKEPIPAYDVQHRKANVDMNFKRGLSSLYGIDEHLDRSYRLLRNMSTVVEIQSAIAMIRKHRKTSGAVENFAARNASFTRQNPLSGNNENFQRIRPGSVLDVKEGSDYEFPAVGLKPGAPVEVLGAELRAIASSKSLPEYMIGSDASNANYSSTMVAESPAVRFLQGEQANVIESDLELIWAAVEVAINAGILKPETVTICDIQAEAPNLIMRDPLALAQANEIYFQIGATSLQTICSGLDLDYEQEQQNRQSHDENFGIDQGATLPGFGE